MAESNSVSSIENIATGLAIKPNNTGQEELNPLAENGTGIVYDIVNTTGVIGKLVIRPKGYTSPVAHDKVAIEIFDSEWRSIHFIPYV